MTDLVSQLVGALDDLIGIADVAMRSANRDGAEYDRDAELAEARAALTAAKAGGWVAVPVEPTQAMLDALHSSAYLPGCYRAMLSARPLPNPPKEQSAGGLGSVDAVANPLSPT